MEIQFRCNNVSRHDQATGRHEQCGQLLQANENHAGLKVRCPKCQQLMVVPVQHELEETEKSSRFEVGETPVVRKPPAGGTVATGYEDSTARFAVESAVRFSTITGDVLHAIGYDRS